MKIIVASNNIMIRTLISQELEFHDYIPVAVKTIDSLVKELCQEVKAIVIDASMINDKEAGAKFSVINKKAQEKKFPIIYIGDASIGEQRELAYKSGATAFIERDLVRDELIFNLDSELRPETLFRGFKAVVVDDTEDALELVADHLEECGVEVIKCSSGFNAFDAIKESDGNLDLIITDQKMDGMTGVELCQKAKMELGLRNIAVIFITGYGDKENILSLYEAGASDHLIKPYFQEELWSKVRGHLKRQQRMRRLKRKINEKEQMDNLKSEFFAISSYNLKTPLDLINGYAEILRDSVSEDETSFVDKIVAGGKQLGELIDELQGLTRFLNSKVDESNMDDVGITNIVKSVVEQRSPTIAREGIKLEFNSTVPADKLIKGNQIALTHAVSNAIAGAVTFANKDDVINIKLDMLSAETVDIQIISPKHGKIDNIINCLFNTLYRNEAAETRCAIGFYIAKNIVEIHQGVFLYHKSDDDHVVAQLVLKANDFS